MDIESMDIGELEANLSNWADRYYNHGDSPVSDVEFDAAKIRLGKLDPSNKLLAQIGAEPAGTTFRHKIPMGSLDNVNNEDEFRKWWSKIQPKEVMVQHKYDGLSLSLEYTKGNLKRALLRGDGIKGEAVTDNIKNCWHVYNTGNVLCLPTTSDICIRGEGVIFKSDFNEHNFPGESNPRNSAVGAIRKTNSPRSRWVRLVCYDIIHDDLTFQSEVEKVEYLKSQGVFVGQYWTCNNPEDVLKIYNDTVKNRSDIPYLIDGLVLKINDIERQRNLGEHNGRPKWATAFKLPSMVGRSVITDIRLSVGHSGQIIPTAEYEPIHLDGRQFTHALLDNFDTIEKLGVGIGATIEIYIAGDIIPKLLRVIEHTTTFPRPTHCPECGAPVEIDGAYTRCTGDSCIGTAIGKINNWIKKTGIKYFGGSRQKTCFEKGLIKTPVDLYKMSLTDLGNLIGDGNAKMVIDEIDAHRRLPLHVFMGSLGIKFLGRSNAQKLIDAGINTLDKFLSLNPANKISGFDNNLYEISEGIIKNRALIEELTSQVEIEKGRSKGGNMGDGSTTFCFTGVRLHGDDKKKFEANGWVEKSGVSKNLDYLVAANPSSNSGKIKKARELGIQVMSMEEYLEMANVV